MNKLIVVSKNKSSYIIYKKKVYDRATLNHEEYFIEKTGKNYKRYVSNSLPDFWKKIKILGMMDGRKKIAVFLGIDTYIMIGEDTHLIRNTNENRLALFLSMKCRGIGIKESDFVNDDYKKEYNSSKLLYGIDQEIYENKSCRYITTGC